MQEYTTMQALEICAREGKRFLSVENGIGMHNIDGCVMNDFDEVFGVYAFELGFKWVLWTNKKEQKDGEG